MGRRANDGTLVANLRPYLGFGFVVALLMYLPRLVDSGLRDGGPVFGAIGMFLVAVLLAQGNHYLLPRLPREGARRYVLLVAANLLAIVVCSALLFRVHLAVFGTDFMAMLRRAYRIRVLLADALAIVYVYYRHYRARLHRIELENLRLRERDLTAQLAGLRRQLDPHFLFNTLNTLSGAVRQDRREESLAMIDDLAECYRYLLRTARKPLVTVGEELDFVRNYTRLLEHRFGHQLQLNFEETQHLRPRNIPPLSLQLLVENAVKHNQLSTENPLHVCIEGHSDGSLTVRNILCPRPGGRGGGEGLSNLRERYVLLGGEDMAPHITQNDVAFAVTLQSFPPA